jgi:hypothetical protein
VDFVAVVDQVIVLLRQRGRLTYRTLQRQFQLDDAALDDLKDELIYGQRRAVDEEGRVLVWTGALPTAECDIRPPAEAERQLHTVLRAVTALLQREQRVTVPRQVNTAMEGGHTLHPPTAAGCRRGA